MNWNWDMIKAKTKIVGKPILYSKSDCEAAAAVVGLSFLPPSYIQYMATFGIGQWVPDLTIVAPKHKHPSLTLKHRVTASKEGILENIKFSARPEVMLRLICIGWWANGAELFWDTGKVSGEEFEICVLCHEDSDVIYCGKNLYEFIDDYWIGGKINLACPLADFSLNSRAEFAVLDES